MPTAKSEFLDKEFNLTALFDTKAVGEGSDEEYVEISGYASTNSEDRHGDVIPASAWEDPDALKNYMKNPIVLAYHDHKRPIGNVTSVKIEAAGLFVTARVYKSADSEVYAMVKAGVLKTFSIGFRLKDLEWDEEREVFVLTKLEMHELSVVSVPANQDALFSLAKQLKASGRSNDLNIKKQEKQMPEPVNPSTIDETMIQKAVADALAKREEQERAAKAAEEKAKAEKDAVAASVAQVMSTQAEKLVADIKASLADETKGMSETIKKYEADIAAKAEEIKALQASKMQYAKGEQKGPVSQADRENAVLLARVLGVKNLQDTKFGKEMVEKAAGFNSSDASVHIPGDHTINNADWETEFATNFWMDVRRELVLEPMFRTINMNNAVMRLPIVPEQGYASYIPVDDLKSASSTASVNSGNRPTELTLVAHKLSAADRIGAEETEDSVLPILGLIRENLMRRMARSSDRSLLRGVGATAADPIKGLAQYAIAASRTTNLSIGGGDTFTALDLQKARRLLGVYGMRPADVAYILSTDAYYDLLEDAEMRKYFDVGPANATILTGEVARVNGSPIIISDEFAAKGIGATGALVVNMRNFVVGNLRNITVRTDEEVASDSTLIVATRRFGMLEMEAGAVAAIQWAA